MRTMFNSSEVLSTRISGALGVTSVGPTISTIHMYLDNNPTEPTDI